MDQLTKIVAKMSILPAEPKTQEFQSLLKTANTPQLVKKAIDKIFEKFDKNGDNYLSIEEAKAFFDCVLINLYGEGNYSASQFNDWFIQNDRDHSGFIDKSEICDFI
jgi:Ca2+-binding EF-hand superfamily protein